MVLHPGRPSRAGPGKFRKVYILVTCGLLARACTTTVGLP